MKSGLSRRQFGKLALKTGAGMALLGALDGFIIEPHFRMAAERIDIKLARLPAEFDGFRIAQLTDIHFGPNVGRKQVQKCIQMVRSFNPDLVVLTGDFVTHSMFSSNRKAEAKMAEPCADALIEFKEAPQIAILGNHDHWTDAGIVHGALAERGITVLRNASTPVERGGKRLWIAGVEDAYEGEANLSAAIARIPADEATILLAHEPDYADFVSHSEVDLQLSGHSHGGQVSIPGIGPLILPRLGRKYHTGHYCIGPLQLYTSRGVGVINPPVRFNCPPEVTLITLKSGPESLRTGA
jgi:uncharacterized protein